MFKFKFLLLLVLTTATVADEADFSDTEICTDPTKNNCDPNAKCTRAVGGVNTDQCTPKFFCECNEGYTGEGTKGCCQKPAPVCPVCPECPKAPVPVPKDAVCAANCDFTKLSLCNYELTGGEVFATINFLFWKNDGKSYGDTDTAMDNFNYVGWDISGSVTRFSSNDITMDIAKHNVAALDKETKVYFTIRTSSPDVKFAITIYPSGSQQILVDFGSTRRGWHTVTGTIPAKTTSFHVWVYGQGSHVSQFGMRKVEVEANC